MTTSVDGINTPNSGTDPTEIQLRVMHYVYSQFRATGQWPLSWRVDITLDELLEQHGGLVAVCDTMKPLVACNSPTQTTGTTMVRLDGLCLLEEATPDVEAFLQLCRYSGAKYRSSESQPVQVSRSEFADFAGLDEASSVRAFEVALLDGRFWSTGSRDHLQLNNFAAKVADVHNVAAFNAAWQKYFDRNYRVITPVNASAEMSERVVEERQVVSVFLSHAADDAQVAEYLANLFRASDSRLSVFVASVPGNIQSGEDWLATIRSQLRSADVFVVLLSRIAATRPWIWYESGAAWFSERRLIPVVLPGFSKSEVPMPLSAHQILSLDSERETEQLFADLGLATPDLRAVVSAMRSLSKHEVREV